MNILEKILNSLETYERGDWNVLLFVLQLMAWEKLSRENQLPPELNFKKHREVHGQGGFVARTLKELLLSESEIAGENAPAFEFNQQTFDLFSPFRLSNLLDLISHYETQPSNNFDEFVETISRTARYNELWLFPPPELTELILKLGEVNQGDEVYCPFEGSLALAVKADYVASNVSVEIRQHSPFPYLLNILFDRNIIIQSSNPISGPWFIENRQLKLFDVVLSNPPIGVRYQRDFDFDIYNRFPEKTMYGEVLQIRHILAQTKRRAVVIVPDGVLFRTAAGERQFKSDLVESGLLRAVVKLPSNILTYSGISLSLIVLDKETKSDSILFIDASSEYFYDKKKGSEGAGVGRRKLVNVDEIFQAFKQNQNGNFSRRVSRLECAENDYNLLPQRYVSQGEGLLLDELIKGDVVKLSELVEFIRPQSLKDYIVEEEEQYFEVAVSDIGADGIIQRPKKDFSISPQSAGKLSQQKLRPQDILLTIKGSTGRVGLVPPELNENWFANQSFLILRMRYNRYFENPIVLFRYLTSPIGQALLQRLVGGTTVPMLQAKDLKVLQVVIPSMEEQQAIIEDHRKIVSIYEEISRLQSEAEVIGQKHWTLN